MDRMDINILIVDRNPHVREFLHREFLHLGFSVRQGWSCREVERLADSQDAPDLIVLDPDLPGQNGYSLIQSLSTSHPEIPVVAHLFSGNASDHPALKGVAQVVEKSGRVEELKRTILKVLRGRYPSLAFTPEETGGD